jgi:hypothetical protein
LANFSQQFVPGRFLAFARAFARPLSQTFGSHFEKDP